MDETWIHHFALESNQQSAELRAAGEIRPKQPKMKTSAGKVLASVFWDAPGNLFIDYFEKGRTLILYCINGAFEGRNHQKKRPQIKKKKVLFHQDNTPCHKLIAMMAKLHELLFKLLLHPPYSPDLAPSNYWLFSDFKRMLQGKRFVSNKEAISETVVYFEAKDKSFNKKRHQIVREALESVYQPRRRLCGWIKSNFA